MEEDDLALPKWLTRSPPWDVGRDEKVEVRWHEGVCLRAVEGSNSRVLGSGIGWLAIVEGSCGHEVRGKPVDTCGPAILSPRGLPLSAKPERAWHSMVETTTLTGGPEGCKLSFWKVEPLDIDDRKAVGKIKEEFELMRPFFAAAGGDPYLHHLRERSGIPHVFDDVPDRDLGTDVYRSIEFHSVETPDRIDGWYPLIEFDKAPAGLMLVLDGWVRTWVNVGEGRRVPRLVDVMRSPVLVGDSERPTSSCGRSAPLLGLECVEVKAIDRSSHRVHYLLIPYGKLDDWYRVSNIDTRLSAYSHTRAHHLHAWLSIGMNKPWRVIRWLLDEHERRRSSGSAPNIWIPKIMLAYKQLVGGAQSADDLRGLHEAAKEYKPGVTDIIDELHKRGWIRKTEISDESKVSLIPRGDEKNEFLSFTVVDGREADLHNALCEAARNTFRVTSVASRQ